MDPDIIDILEADWHDGQEDSDDEGGDVGEGVEGGENTPLDILGRKVKENFVFLNSPAPSDISPLTLGSLKEKYPQVCDIQHCV